MPICRASLPWIFVTPNECGAYRSTTQLLVDGARIRDLVEDMKLFVEAALTWASVRLIIAVIKPILSINVFIFRSFIFLFSFETTGDQQQALGQLFLMMV